MIWRVNEIVVRHLSCQTKMRYRSREKRGGGQSFGSSPLVAEAKFLPDPGEVVAAYRTVPPLL